MLLKATTRKSSTKIHKYNLIFDENTHPISIELQMVRMGGRFQKKDGSWAGNGLEEHFKNLQSLMWPWMSWHKWSIMQMDAYLNYRTIVVIGPASSGKTFSAASNLLADYFCYPTCTTGLVCSTTRERLEDRIWGEMKKLFKLAKGIWKHLPGNLIEGRQRLVSDDSTMASEGRDFRNGIIGVPCAPSGTPIDTPAGKRSIELIRVDDVVTNASGCGRVLATHTSVARYLVRVSLADGRHFDITPDHPIFTERGWVDAIDLNTSDMVFSACETVRILRKRHNPPLSESQILQRVFRSGTGADLCVVHEEMETDTLYRQSLQAKVLQSILCKSMGVQEHRFEHQNRNMPLLRIGNFALSPEQGLLFSSLPQQSYGAAMSLLREVIHFDPRISRETEDSILQLVLQAERSENAGKAKGDCYSHEGRTEALEAVSRIEMELSLEDWFEAEGWKGALGENRLSFSGSKVGCGSRWGDSPNARGYDEGLEKKQIPLRTRVASVEVLQSASDPRFDGSLQGYQVYNLEVEGHPSYSVNGVIVHNCKKGTDYVGLGDFIGIKNKRVRLVGDELHLLPRVFVDAISNLDKNQDLKVVGLGNPKETTDALGVLAEPSAEYGGWEGGIDQTEVTKTWKTRRPDGICVQLVGTDSPNLDGKLGIPLITQAAIDRDIAFYGKDSLQFTMMNLGMMPRGQGSRRVITRQLCQKFNAFDSPIWRDSNRVKIGFLDAAYRGVGGDRCVFGWLEFGIEGSASAAELSTQVAQSIVNQKPDSPGRKTIMALGALMIVPIKVVDTVGKRIEQVEDQIVEFVMENCTTIGIPPENFFYDSGMRTSLVSSFGRLWSVNTNPIDCGGSPSERKVSEGIDVIAKDYYSKKITELWFSVRMVIEAGQFRSLTDDVVMEGCAREWKLVGANKIEVESKQEMKQKTGRSPDLFDALCMGVEGARQRGFQIGRLSKVHRKKKGEIDWRDQLKAKSKSVWNSKNLAYSA